MNKKSKKTTQKLSKERLRRTKNKESLRPGYLLYLKWVPVVEL